MSLNLHQLNKRKIGVLHGGSSSERAISLLSGAAVHEALISLGLDVVLIDVRPDNYERAIGESEIDLAFNALHGSFGEDGVLQAWLEREKIPCTGSSSEACRRAMDKEVSRRLFAEQGLKVARGVAICRRDEAVARALRYPLFVKPASGGSSIAVSLVKNAGALDRALDTAFGEDSKVIVEERIVGRELTVGILGNDAIGTIEIRTEREFFDYEAKYHDAATYEELADLSPQALEGIESAGVAAHKALGCAGFSRADIILAEDGPYVLEINAIPGMTKKSLLPKMAAKKGIPFPELCVRIIKEIPWLKEDLKIRSASI